MSETKGLTRQQMADRVALEFQDGWIVNLGVGIPTLCSNTDIGDRDIIYHSENGVIGYGPIAAEGAEDLNLVNAGGQNANWKLKGQKGGGIGGAMDLAACAKRVFIILEHVTRDGSPRLVQRCDLPVTARGVVTLVATNYGLFQPTGSGFVMREIAPGFTVEEVRAATGAPLIAAEDLRAMRMAAS